MEFGTRLPLAASKAPKVLYGAASNLLQKLKVSVRRPFHRKRSPFSSRNGHPFVVCDDISPDRGVTLKGTANFPQPNQVKQTHQRLSNVGLRVGKDKRQRSARDNNATIWKAEKQRSIKM